MRFIATADSDIGISKATNQDSVLIKQAKVDGEEVLLAVICDGMGGLSNGSMKNSLTNSKMSICKSSAQNGFCCSKN